MDNDKKSQKFSVRYGAEPKSKMGSFAEKIAAKTTTKAPELKYDYEVKSKTENHTDITVSLNADYIAWLANKKFAEELKTYKFSNFPEGRVPRDIAAKNLLPGIIEACIESTVNQITKEIFKLTGIVPVEHPTVNVNKLDEQKHLCFEMSVNTMPTVSGIKLGNISIKTCDVQISDKDMKNAHEKILSDFSNYTPTKQPAKNGDIVVVDFVGTVDNGKEFSGGHAKDLYVLLGKNSILENFDQNLINATAGTTKEFDLSFPNNYKETSLAGKKAHFEVKVKEVKEPKKMTAIDNDFAKNMGFDTLEALNAALKERMSMEYYVLSRFQTKKRLFDALLQHYDIDVPDAMVENDFNTIWNDASAQYDKNPAAFGNKGKDKLKADYKNVAKRRVKLGIILNSIAQDNKIAVEDADLHNMVIMEAVSQPGKEQLVFDYYKNPDNLQKLTGPALEEKVVDFILSKIKVDKEAISSNDFIVMYQKELQDWGNK